MDYKQKYEESLERAKVINPGTADYEVAVKIFPELKKSKDDIMRNFISHELACIRATDEKGSDRYEELTNAIAWLEMQGKHSQDYPYIPGWRENRPDNKPKIKHSILMLTTHGVAEGEWLGEEWCQYRWSCKIKDTEVLYWLHLSDLETLEKENVEQGEQKPTDKVEPKFKEE